MTVIEVLCSCGCGTAAPLWRRNEFTKGRIKGTPMRFLPGHFIPAPTDPAERFWRKVTGGDVTDCWEWQGYVMPNGYGQFGASRGRIVLAHRWSYEYMRDTIPAGLDIDHLCANRRCVNPWHLEPVTRTVNLARQERHQSTNCTKEL